MSEINKAYDNVTRRFATCSREDSAENGETHSHLPVYLEFVIEGY